MASTKDIFQEFVKTCSIKGLPKMFKSNTLSLKILWLLGFSFGISLGLYQTVVILAAYFAFDTRTLVHIQQSAINDFPDITVCKVNPSTILGQEGNQTFESYVSKVADVIAKETNPDVKDKLQSINGLFGFYRNVPIDQNSVEENLKNFVVYCKVLKRKKSINCVPEVFRFLTPGYPLCAVFSQKNHRTIDTWSAVFYLDDFDSTSDTQFYKYPKAKYHSGVELFLHDTNVHPNSQPSFIIGPGVESFQTVELVSMKLLPHPYSDCTDNKINYEKGREPYSFENCEEECIQNETIAHCGCLDPDIPIRNHEETAKFCGYLFTNTSHTATQISCWEDLVLDIGSKCRSKCTSACSTAHYIVDTASAPWPHVSRHLAFYQTFIKDKPAIYGKKIDQYKDIEREMITDRMRAYERVRSIDLLSRNFLKVTINMLDTSWTYDKVPAMSLSLATGSLGGVLNLWVGISFITAVEILELLVRLIQKKPETGLRNSVSHQMASSGRGTSAT